MPHPFPPRRSSDLSADLVAERPRHPVFPHHARTRRQVEPVAGRPDRGEPAPPADAAGRVGSKLGSGPALSKAEPKRPARVQISRPRSEEHTSELQSLMRNSYAVFCLEKKKT